MPAIPAQSGRALPRSRVVEVESAHNSSAPTAGAVGFVSDEWLGPASAQVPSGAKSIAVHEAKPESAEERSRRRRVTGLVFLTVFIDFLGLGVLLPVTPFLVARFKDDALAVGVLSAAFAFSQFIATPVLGAMSDRWGRRPVLIFSLVGSAIGYGVLGLAGALWVMIVARVIDGVTGANVSTAQAALADITPGAKRSRAFALIGVAVGLGFVMGPALGGVLAERSLTLPVFVAGGLSLLAGVFAWFALPETLTSARRRRGALTSREVNPLAHIGSAWRVPSVRWAVLALLCAGVPFAALSSNLGVYVGRVFSMGPKDAAMLLTWMGVVMMVMQGVVVRRLSGRVDDRMMAMAGLAIFGVGLLVIAFVPQPGWWGLYVGIGLFAAGHGLCSPTLTSVVSRGVDERAQGSVLGVATGLLSLTRVVGPLLAGVLFDHLSPGSVYWSGAVWVLVALVLVGMGMRCSVAKH